MKDLDSWVDGFSAESKQKPEHNPRGFLRFIAVAREGASSQFANMRARRRVRPSRFLRRRGRVT